MDVDDSVGVKTRASRKRSFAVVDSNLPQDESDSVLESPPLADCKHQDFTPRSYQSEVFQVARKRNTIAVMETGSGKTMIAVMLIREIGLATKSSGKRKLLIFLAPTVHLVHQQFKVIKIHTNFEVGEYYGAKGVDEWRAECWDKEINEHDVLVMTPQILLDALRKSFLSLEKVCLLIIDECHRATGNHPYTKIMKEFYYKSKDKPKIFGMTASPVARKCKIVTLFVLYTSIVIVTHGGVSWFHLYLMVFTFNLLTEVMVVVDIKAITSQVYLSYCSTIISAKRSSYVNEFLTSVSFSMKFPTRCMYKCHCQCG